MASKSLTELMAQADERGLAASGLACLDRCLPLLAAPSTADDALRPLWAGLVDGEEDWSGRLAAARQAMENAAVADDAATLVRKMLGAAPSEWEVPQLREWADKCSLAALELHHRFDTAPETVAADILEQCRAGASEAAGPLVSGELRRQIRILELLADDPRGSGLRAALDLSTEGQRVLRAVVSRRARVQG